MATGVTPSIPRSARAGRKLAAPVALVPRWSSTELASFDRDYWLAHCEGYRVDGPGGRIGLVEEVRPGRGHPRDTVLVVRAGRLGRHVLLVSAAEAEFVVPRAERIWLRTAAILGSEPRQEPTAA